MAPLTAALLLHALWHTATASTVVVYSDAECKTIASNLTAPNGYPDGECTDVAQQTANSFQSFQFSSLDTDCAPTVYQASEDDDCSGYAIVASVGTCYNTSWVDYSVDGCTAPAGSTTSGNGTVTSSVPPVVLPTTTSTPASTSSGAAPSSTGSATSGASVRPLSRPGSLAAGAAVVSGLCFLLW